MNMGENVNAQIKCRAHLFVSHCITDNNLSEVDTARRRRGHNYNLSTNPNSLTLSSLKTATAVERIFPFVPENR